MGCQLVHWARGGRARLHWTRPCLPQMTRDVAMLSNEHRIDAQKLTTAAGTSTKGLHGCLQFYSRTWCVVLYQSAPSCMRCLHSCAETLHMQQIWSACLAALSRSSADIGDWQSCCCARIPACWSNTTQAGTWQRCCCAALCKSELSAVLTGVIAHNPAFWSDSTKAQSWRSCCCAGLCNFSLSAVLAGAFAGVLHSLLSLQRRAGGCRRLWSIWRSLLRGA